MQHEISENGQNAMVEAIAARVTEKLLQGPIDLPYYMTLATVSKLLGIEAKNIPAELPRFYPNGRRRNPLFRRDHVIAFIEQKRRDGPDE